MLVARELHVPKWEDLMSHKSSVLLSERNLMFDRRAGWTFSSACASDVRFLRSWLVDDSTLAADAPREKFNWNFLIGMLVACGASAGFWAGIGMAVASLR